MLAQLRLLALSLTMLSLHTDTRVQQPVKSAVFELVNKQSGMMKIGTNRIVAVSAVANHVSKEPPYGAEAIELAFITKAELDAKKTTGAEVVDRVSFIIYFDKDRKVTRVNMSFQAPGIGVGRIVASTPAELSGAFSNVRFDGSRLLLSSKGRFDELNAKKELLSLAWDMDIDLAVQEKPAELPCPKASEHCHMHPFANAVFVAQKPVTRGLYSRGPSRSRHELRPLREKARFAWVFAVSIPRENR